MECNLRDYIRDDFGNDTLEMTPDLNLETISGVMSEVISYFIDTGNDFLQHLPLLSGTNIYTNITKAEKVE